MYIAIDGDDSGRKIAACYINNDELKLRQISESLDHAAKTIADLLKSKGFRVIFSAADGVTAVSNDDNIILSEIFDSINGVLCPEFTFSAGAGQTLREAYIALLNAKSSGKNRLCVFSDI